MPKVVNIHDCEEFITPDKLLEECKGKLTEAIVLGYNKEGGLFIRSSNNMTRKDAVWILEKAKIDALGE